MSAADDIRSRPFPMREKAEPITEEQYGFPGGTICRLWLGTLGWKIEYAGLVQERRTLNDARALKDALLMEVCTEMSEKARGVKV
jgi:hypothetical protein